MPRRKITLPHQLPKAKVRDLEAEKLEEGGIAPAAKFQLNERTVVEIVTAINKHGAAADFTIRRGLGNHYEVGTGWNSRWAAVRSFADLISAQSWLRAIQRAQQAPDIEGAADIILGINPSRGADRQAYRISTMDDQGRVVNIEVSRDAYEGLVRSGNVDFSQIFNADD